MTQEILEQFETTPSVPDELRELETELNRATERFTKRMKKLGSDKGIDLVVKVLFEINPQT